MQYAQLMAQVHECGHRDEDWTFTNDDGEIEELDPPPFVAQGLRCRACKAMARAQRELSEAYKDDPADSDGVYVRLVPNPVIDDPVPSTAEDVG